MRVLKRLLLGVAVVVIGFVGTVFLVMLVVPSARPAQPAAAAATPRPAPTATSATVPKAAPTPKHPSIGTETTLRSDAFLSVDRAAYSQWMMAAVSNDRPTMQQMIDQQRAFQVPARARVLVLDLEWGIEAHVKVLEGPQAGRDGWVAFQRLNLP